ncbi:hypothetical protein PIB30_100657 [Stylosanthes scabra]|uniref:Uncharacterized protein n=1 Tax=Stylosanthes scabra TaxID=79078 RepID=A0ABU6RXN1_9FABA|nr:hypothetical protein [Stylosanthes scabra]
MLKNREGAEQANPPVIMEAGGEIQEGGGQWFGARRCAIQLLQSDYEVKLDELSNQMNSMMVQIQRGSWRSRRGRSSWKIMVLKSENDDPKGEKLGGSSHPKCDDDGDERGGGGYGFSGGWLEALVTKRETKKEARLWTAM